MKYIFIFLSLLFSFVGFATAQAGDLIIYQGDTLSLLSNPLEQYFDEKGKRTINNQPLQMTSTACYRGYKATWEIRNDSLFLLSVQESCFGKGAKFFDLEKEFDAKIVFAKSFTDSLLIPKGSLIYYVHSAYESIYEEEILISFK